MQSDINSPGQQQGSPLGATQLAGGCHDDLAGDSASTQPAVAMDDPAWPYDAEDLEVKYFFLQKTSQLNYNFFFSRLMICL